MKKFTTAILFLTIGLSTIGYANSCTSCEVGDETKPKMCNNGQEFPKDKEPKEDDASEGV